MDIERKLLAIDAELHASLEMELLDDGSKQENLWGVNLYPKAPSEQFIEYSALINIRPAQNNPSMIILHEGIREAVKEVVSIWIEDGA